MTYKQKKLLAYLQEHPTWHFGLDLVKEKLGNRGTIYISLGILEDKGLVERRDIDAYMGKRAQFRATGKRVEEPMNAAPSFA